MSKDTFDIQENIIEANEFNALVESYSKNDFNSVIKHGRELIKNNSKDWRVPNLVATSYLALSKKDDAIKIYLEAIKIFNNQVELYNNLGACYRYKGLLDEAIQSFKKAIKVNKNYSDAKFNLANSLLEKKDIDEAIQIYKDILKTNENDHIILSLLGDCYRIKKQFNKAYEALTNSIKIKPLDTSYNNLGILFLENNKDTEAMNCFVEAIKLNKTNINPYNNLNELYLKYKKNKEAIVLTNEAISIFPNNHNAYFMHALALEHNNQFDDAIVFYKKTIELNTTHQKAYNNLAVCFTHLRKTNDALNIYEKVIKSKIHNADILYNYASLLSKVGKSDVAEKIIRKTILEYPNYTKIYPLLGVVKKFTEKDKDFNSMVHLFKELDNTNPDKSEIGFTLGKITEKFELYDEAASYFKKSNIIKNGNLNYDINRHLSQFKALSELFLPDFIRTYENQGFESNSNIFVIGMPRSGSTLLEQILSSHSEVDGFGELRTMTQVINDLNTNIKGFDELKNAPSDYFCKIGEEYNLRVKREFKPNNIFVDKALMFDRIGFISLALPNSKIIHCKRNKNDQLLSIYKNYFMQDFHPYSYNAKNLLLYYEGYENMMHHWNKVFENKILEINYEDLISRPKNVVQNLLNFCGLEWQEECLNYYKNNNNLINTISSQDARKPLYNSSINLWKKYKDSLKEIF